MLSNRYRRIMNRLRPGVSFFTHRSFELWPNNVKNVTARSNTNIQSGIIHVDFYETDIPGSKKKDVIVRLLDDDKVLLIDVMKEQTVSDESKKSKATKVHTSERIFGHEKRYIRLPEDSDPQFIAAAFNDGVLNISIPKIEDFEPKGRVVDIISIL